MSAEESPSTDKRKMKNLSADLEICLSNFERAKEWADLIACLQKCIKILSKHSQLRDPPHRELLCKRLAQCVNRALPAGVHGKAIDVYDTLLGMMTKQAILTDMGAIMMGVLPLLQYASTTNKPSLLRLLERRILPLGEDLSDVMPGLIAGLLPGLEDKNADSYEQTLSCMDTLAETADPGQFLSVFWSTMSFFPSLRLPASVYMQTLLSKPSFQPDNGFNWNLAAASVADCLSDTSVLVVRAVLDLTVSHFRLDVPQLVECAEFPKLFKAVVALASRRDGSLTRRLTAWIRQPEESVAVDARNLTVEEQSLTAESSMQCSSLKSESTASLEAASSPEVSRMSRIVSKLCLESLSSSLSSVDTVLSGCRIMAWLQQVLPESKHGELVACGCSSFASLDMALRQPHHNSENVAAKSTISSSQNVARALETVSKASAALRSALAEFSFNAQVEAITSEVEMDNTLPSVHSPSLPVPLLVLHAQLHCGSWEDHGSKAVPCLASAIFACVEHLQEHPTVLLHVLEYYVRLKDRDQAGFEPATIQSSAVNEGMRSSPVTPEPKARGSPAVFHGLEEENIGDIGSPSHFGQYLSSANVGTNLVSKLLPVVQSRLQISDSTDTNLWLACMEFLMKIAVELFEFVSYLKATSADTADSAKSPSPNKYVLAEDISAQQSMEVIDSLQKQFSQVILQLIEKASDLVSLRMCQMACNQWLLACLLGMTGDTSTLVDSLFRVVGSELKDSNAEDDSRGAICLLKNLACNQYSTERSTCQNVVLDRWLVHIQSPNPSPAAALLFKALVAQTALQDHETERQGSPSFLAGGAVGYSQTDCTSHPGVMYHCAHPYAPHVLIQLHKAHTTNVVLPALSDVIMQSFEPVLLAAVTELCSRSNGGMSDKPIDCRRQKCILQAVSTGLAHRPAFLPMLQDATNGQLSARAEHLLEDQRKAFVRLKWIQCPALHEQKMGSTLLQCVILLSLRLAIAPAELLSEDSDVEQASFRKAAFCVFELAMQTCDDRRMASLSSDLVESCCAAVAVRHSHTSTAEASRVDSSQTTRPKEEILLDDHAEAVLVACVRAIQKRYLKCNTEYSRKGAEQKLRVSLQRAASRGLEIMSRSGKSSKGLCAWIQWVSTDGLGTSPTSNMGQHSSSDIALIGGLSSQILSAVASCDSGLLPRIHDASLAIVALHRIILRSVLHSNSNVMQGIVGPAPDTVSIGTGVSASLWARRTMVDLSSSIPHSSAGFNPYTHLPMMPQTIFVHGMSKRPSFSQSGATSTSVSGAFGGFVSMLSTPFKTASDDSSATAPTVGAHSQAGRRMKPDSVRESQASTSPSANLQAGTSTPSQSATQAPDTSGMVLSLLPGAIKAAVKLFRVATSKMNKQIPPVIVDGAKECVTRMLHDLMALSPSHTVSAILQVWASGEQGERDRKELSSESEEQDSATIIGMGSLREGVEGSQIWLSGSVEASSIEPISVAGVLGEAATSERITLMECISLSGVPKDALLAKCAQIILKSLKTARKQKLRTDSAASSVILSALSLIDCLLMRSQSAASAANDIIEALQAISSTVEFHRSLVGNARRMSASDLPSRTPSEDSPSTSISGNDVASPASSVLQSHNDSIDPDNSTTVGSSLALNFATQGQQHGLWRVWLCALLVCTRLLQGGDAVNRGDRKRYKDWGAAVSSLAAAVFQVVAVDTGNGGMHSAAVVACRVMASSIRILGDEMGEELDRAMVLHHFMHSFKESLRKDKIERLHMRALAALFNNISKVPAIFKGWRGSLRAFFIDGMPPSCDAASLRLWRGAVDSCLNSEGGDAISDIITKSAGAGGLHPVNMFVGSKDEKEIRVRLLQMLAFTLLTGEVDQYVGGVASAMERVGMTFKSVQSRALPVECEQWALLVCCTLTMRMSQENLVLLWPTLLSELRSILSQSKSAARLKAATSTCWFMGQLGLEQWRIHEWGLFSLARSRLDVASGDLAADERSILQTWLSSNGQGHRDSAAASSASSKNLGKDELEWLVEAKLGCNLQQPFLQDDPHYDLWQSPPVKGIWW